jgi:hypothetical protein
LCHDDRQLQRQGQLDPFSLTSIEWLLSFMVPVREVTGKVSKMGGHDAGGALFLDAALPS